MNIIIQKQVTSPYYRSKLFRQLKITILKLKKTHRHHYQNKDFTQNQKNKLVYFIILLMTISQFSVSIYLPSMPNMTKFFGTPHDMIQLSLTLYLIGYGISQFFYGPLSDIYGRRLIILIGLIIFNVASVATLSVNNIHLFLIARIMQGIGIGCGDTMGRAILCDCFKEQAFVKAACRIGLAATITPLIGPIMGGYLETLFNWRSNFVFIFLYGFISLLLVFFYLPETKPRELFGATKLRAVLNTYRFILKNKIFLGFFIPGLVCFVGETMYSIISPFLIQQQLGWSPIAFGWSSLVIILGLLLGTSLANGLSRYISYHYMVGLGLIILFTAALLMLGLGLEGLKIVYLILPMMIFMVGVGIIYPNTNMGALIPFTTMAGTAGALQGGLQMIIGGSLASVIGEMRAETSLPLALALTIFSLLGIITFYFLLKDQLFPLKNFLLKRIPDDNKSL